MRPTRTRLTGFGRLLAAPFVIAALAIVGTSCSHRVPEPVPHPTGPHLTWSIAIGDREDEVCNSTTPTACIIESSRAGRSPTATFHLFMHAAANETRYTGTVQAGFLGGPAASVQQHRVDLIVKVGSAPVNFSTTYMVQPAGTYSVFIDLHAASVSNTGSSLPLKVRIPVTVK